MSQYTSTQTINGFVFNTTLDTETNTKTTTITSPDGVVASNTTDASESGSQTTNLNALRDQLVAGGVDLNLIGIGILRGTRDTTSDVKAQAATAQAEATASGNPPPAESQAIPVAADSNPTPSPAQDTTQVENATPPDTTDPGSANTGNDANATSETVEAQKTVPADTPTGPARDDAGFLLPGWSVNENNDPVWVGKNKDGTIFVEPATQASAAQSRQEFSAIQGLKARTQAQAVGRRSSDIVKNGDWRVRLSLAPGADYLYKAPPQEDQGILEPLRATDGIIFPYTPSISVSYNASYDPTDLTHSNYKIYQYKGSSVDNINITCDFTAQDTQEANYLLATIHFLRTITKMFYGKDNGPPAGTPPPLVYLTGLGAFQFDRHPLAITNFNYTLPNEVDYIRAGVSVTPPGISQSTPADTNKSFISEISAVANRLFGSNLLGGAQKAPPQWKTTQTGTVTEPTYVPTKMSIQITAVPIVSRGDISNRFSLTQYANGSLLRGSKNNTGGIW